jgi:AraC family transcriptional regulator, transcriptional activator of pobA
MHTFITEAVIPKYPFELDAETGNTMFRINRNDCVVNYKKSDFLVPHRKNYYFMAFVKQGNNRHWIDTIPYTLKPNAFYFTIPHQVHLKEVTEPFSGISLSFTEDFLAMDDSNSLKNLPIIQNPDNGHELLLSNQDVIFIDDLLEKIFAENNSKNEWQHNMLLAYMKVLLIYLSRLYTEQFSHQEQSPGRILLKKYLAKIDEAYTSNHEVANYADMLNISPGHLSELIKEQSGKPAITHIHERLIVEAKRLLFHTDYAVKEIAFHLGFEDASYFNRFFKRLTDTTPVNFRTSIREMYH